MSIAFSDSELINIAIGIERRGITFYDTMTKSTKTKQTPPSHHIAQALPPFTSDCRALTVIKLLGTIASPVRPPLASS